MSNFAGKILKVQEKTRKGFLEWHITLLYFLHFSVLSLHKVCDHCLDRVYLKSVFSEKLTSEGTDLSQALMVNLGVKKMSDFTRVNSIYKKYLQLNPPSR